MMKKNASIHYMQTFSLKTTNVLCAPGVCADGPPEWSKGGWSHLRTEEEPSVPASLGYHLQIALESAFKKVLSAKIPPVFWKALTTLWWCPRFQINQRHSFQRRLSSNSTESPRPTDMLTNHVTRQFSPLGILKPSSKGPPQVREKVICLCTSANV